MEECVTVVRGRRTVQVHAAVLREWIHQHERVIVDLGTGDGRWLYRTARQAPTSLCLGVDAGADAMREVSHRASRKPARGGLPNLCFIAAAVESLPAGLARIADEVWVTYPWGSLLRAVLAPAPTVLRGVANLLKPHGMLVAAINASLLDQAAVLERLKIAPRSRRDLFEAVRAGYNEAGLELTAWRFCRTRLQSSWGGRLGQGRGLPTLWVEARRDGDGRGHGRG